LSIAVSASSLAAGRSLENVACRCPAVRVSEPRPLRDGRLAGPRLDDAALRGTDRQRPDPQIKLVVDDRCEDRADGRTGVPDPPVRPVVLHELRTERA